MIWLCRGTISNQDDLLAVRAPTNNFGTKGSSLMTSVPPVGPEGPRDPVEHSAPFASPSGPPPVNPASQSGWGKPTTEVGYGQPRFGQYAPGGGPHPLPGQPFPPGQYGVPQYGYGGPGWAPMAPKPGIIPLRPLSLGEIYDGAFAAIRKNPKVMLGLVALVVSVATIIPAIINFFIAPSLNSWLDKQLTSFTDNLDSTTTEITLTPITGQVSLSLLISIGLYFASIVTTGILIVAVSRAVINKPVLVGEVWGQVRSKIGGLILISLLPALAIAAASLLLILMVGALIYVDTNLEGPATILAVFALLAGAIWLSIRFLLTPAAYVLEGQGLGSAIKRGWKVSQGSFWRLLGIYLLSTIITTIVTSLISAPGSTLASFLFDSSSASDIGSTITIVLTQILASTISATFLSTVIALLYIDVRMRKEGLDVELNAAANQM